MELSPTYRARRHRRQAQESIDLAMKTQGSRSLALLIDTAIESSRKAKEAVREERGAHRPG